VRLHAASTIGIPALLKELGELLADHVRLEENELFPAIEESLDDGQLYRLAADVAAAEREAAEGESQFRTTSSCSGQK
jgi:hemerythrin-like domain-containing protein